MNLFILDVNGIIVSNTRKNHFLKINDLFSCCYIITTKEYENYYNQVNRILRALNFKNIKKCYGTLPDKNYIHKFLKHQELSYINAWKEILTKQEDNIMIVDDDIRPIFNFYVNFSKSMHNIPDDWDILYLGASQHDWKNINAKEAYLNGYYKASNTKGSFAMIINKRCIKQLIVELNKNLLRQPLDEIINSLKLKKYVLFPNIFISDVSRSLIRDPRSEIVKHASIMKWDLLCYDYFRFLKVPALCYGAEKINQSYENIIEIKNENEKISEKNFIHYQKNKYKTNYVYYNLKNDTNFYLIEEHIKMLSFKK